MSYIEGARREAGFFFAFSEKLRRRVHVGGQLPRVFSPMSRPTGKTHKMEGVRRFAGCGEEEAVKETMTKRLGDLLSVKSLVTLVLTAVFAYMAVTGQISQDFMTIYAVIIAFYFGTQSQKTQTGKDGGRDGGTSL